MTVRLLGLAVMLTLASTVEGVGQNKPTLLVDTFVVPSGVSWPYDVNNSSLRP